MRKAYLQYFVALLLFGMNGLLVSAISLPSCEIVFLRTLLGSGVLLCLVAALKPARLSSFDGLFVVGSGVAMGGELDGSVRGVPAYRGRRFLVGVLPGAGADRWVGAAFVGRTA